LDNDCDGDVDEDAPGSPDLLDFEPAVSTVSLITGDTSNVSLPLNNPGAEPVRVTEAAFLSSFSSPTATIQTAVPFTVCPGGSSAIDLVVDATGALNGSYDGTVRLTNGLVAGEANGGLTIGVSSAGLPDLEPVVGTGPTISIVGALGAPPLDSAEAFTVSMGVTNSGVGAASTFDVYFYDGDNVLGSDTVGAGLAVGGSTTVELSIDPNDLADGFHVVRTVIAQPAEGELRLTNNAAATIVQIGTLPVSSAVIDVVATVNPNCDGTVWYVNGRADYFLVDDQGSLVDFPVQGALVTVRIYDGTGTTLLREVTGMHTLTTGSFSKTIHDPPSGAGVVRVEVTDFSIDPPGLEEITPPVPPDCPAPAGTSSTDPTPYTDLSICSTDLEWLQADCATPIAGTPLPEDTVCLRATIHNSGPSGSGEQLARFRAQIPGGNAVELMPAVPFQFVGAGTVDLFQRWSPADSGFTDGVPVVTVDIVTTGLSQNTSNDVATRGLPLGTGLPQTEINLDSSVGGGCSVVTGVGNAFYTGAGGAPVGAPVSCGMASMQLWAAGDPGTILRQTSGYRCSIGGHFYLVVEGLPTGSYEAEIRVDDGSLTGTAQHSLDVSCDSAASDPVAPPPATPNSPPSADLFVHAEDVAFLGDGTCTTGLFANPEAGDTIGVFATVHYFGTDPLVGQPVTVTEYRPVDGTMVASTIGSTTVDFLSSGGGLATLCMPWTPDTDGTRVVQVLVEPTISQYLLNDAATRVATVGTAKCGLELDVSTLDFPLGGTAQLTVSGFDETGLTGALDLSVVSPSGLPSGFTFDFQPGSPLDIPGSTVLTIDTNGSPEGGRHSIFIVGTSAACNAAAVFTLNVPSCNDADGDGYGSPGQLTCPAGGQTDCDDGDPATHPGATEQCDGIDNDCDGAVPFDEIDDDGDGMTECDGDCDDTASNVYSGAPEQCDGIDNDCDGTVPFDEIDDDGDGMTECDGDCDDTASNVYSGAPEQCDGIDNDCDGTVPFDEIDDDGDGMTECDGDCDDGASDIYLGAPEVCDYVDNDCDAVVDDEAPCASAEILKLTEGQIVGPDVVVWTFMLDGPYVSESDTQDAAGVVDFGGVNLVPGSVYTICENDIPAGWTSLWWIDANGNRTWELGETALTPYNPNLGDTPPQDLGNRCYDVTLAESEALVVTIDNSHPGGDPRTIGYWKNWNTCTAGNQYQTADHNGGPDAGWYILDDLLPQQLGLLSITACGDGVNILDKRDLSGTNRANDAAYELAAQALAAQMNLASGAESCPQIQDTMLSGLSLLTDIAFSGEGSYLASGGNGKKKRGGPDQGQLREQATDLAAMLDQYNQGNLCQ
jgi:hypothetical protein